MRRLAVPFLALVACLAAAAAISEPPADAAGCGAPPVAGSHGVHVAYGGHMRFFQIHVPAGTPAGARLPLVLALHGSGGSGTQMERYSGLSSVADRHGFAVVYPSAASPVWNITADPRDADDVGYVASVITFAERSLCIDSRRVYATGVSNGAGMVALLGCRLSTRLAAIAPVEGIYDDGPPCRPARPLSILEIHGTADTIAPYFGRRNTASAGGVPPFVTSWADRDECSGKPRSRSIAARTTAVTWGGCTNDTVVEHIRIQGGRHQWPGATPADPGPPATICASCAVWSFFSPLRLSRPPTSGGAGLQ